MKTKMKSKFYWSRSTAVADQEKLLKHVVDDYKRVKLSKSCVMDMYQLMLRHTASLVMVKIALFSVTSWALLFLSLIVV